jgi:hypothetical protein
MANPEKKNDNMNALVVPVTPILDERTLVLEALNNPDYTWRTIGGIAKETRIPKARVARILDSLSDSVIRSSAPDPRGRTLYTTLDNYRAHSGILRRVLSALSDQVK